MAKISFSILLDGTIKWDIEGAIAGPDHTRAELFMQKVAQLSGGETEIEQKEHGHHHHDLEIEGDQESEFHHH